MRNQSRNGQKTVALVAAGLALALGGRAYALPATNYVVQTFSQTFALTASPTGALPQINTTWNISQYNGFGGLTSLSQVQYSLSTELYYRGVLVAIGSSKTYGLQVRSDFNFDLPGSTADVTNLDPTVSVNNLSSTSASLTQFDALTGPLTTPTIGASTNSTTLLASDLVTYVGSGTLPVGATGGLLSTGSGTNTINTSDLGLLSPYVFVSNAKVFPVFGLQEYSLVANLTLTYTVPEPGTYAAVGFVSFLVWRQWASRRRRKA